MLVEAILRDVGMDLDLSVERDYVTLRNRCKHEGFSFLAITLPQLSSALLQGIEAGSFTCPSSFSAHGSLPRFMGGFFKRVFTKTGGLRPNACPYAIKAIRDVCDFFKKPKMPCKASRNREAEKHFLEVEGELRRMTPQIERMDNVLDKVSGIIWAQVFPELDVLDLVCHHGPGFTADRRLPNERHRISKWNHRSELTFPSDLHCYPNYGFAEKFSGTGEGSVTAEGGVDYLELRDELPVRVVFVPKTMTTPRVIAIEPSHMQYTQQALKDWCYMQLETHALTKRSIRFRRQDVNQRLAHRSSIDRSLTTLDLKDASDRVHLALVQRIFKTSGILQYLEDTRSLHATLPSGRNIVLNKFASMGSALCFPVEAMVFYTLIQSAMHQLDGRRPSSQSIRRYSEQIDVYGDDIIIPVAYTDVVVRYLESYALKVNVNKSFRNSHFRESCGADYYNGVSVRPIYARRYPSDTSRDWGAEELLSWNATADLFYLEGKWHTAQVIRDMLRRVTRRPISRTRQVGAGLAHLSLLFTTGLSYNKGLQCWQQKRTVFTPTKKKDRIDGNDLACLNKWALSNLADYRNNGNRVPSESWGRLDLLGPDRSRKLGEDERGSTSNVLDLQGLYVRGGPCTDGVRLAAPEVDAIVCESSVEGLPSSNADASPICDESAKLFGLPTHQSYDDDTSARQETHLERIKQMLIQVSKDPCAYLTDRNEGLDFLASTKRGGFKSKRRWVTLAG